ncbi:expressed unknown protein [Seminavis robusta]|uniref:Uncharacterized protein n=1 Tax=Seminavis robusta TaxID=568900 RepID=A0A9N8H178_9STRA|nr:expressed unknown protein [Seminavis robusta]|eukprot:Sro1_g000110.1 n/a (214) ;mRNA; f:43578-44219
MSKTNKSTSSLPPKNAPSLEVLAVTSFVLELWHFGNSLPVKNRWDTWHIHSMLDSYVIHTMLGLVVARYFRAWHWWEAVLFAISRVLVEGFLSAEHGGMMAIKDGGLVEKGYYAVPGGLYLLYFLLTMGIFLIRGQVLHPIFLFLGLWAYVMTILPAGEYLTYGTSWGYYLAHAANFITFNPALIALITGYGGPAAADSSGLSPFKNVAEKSI